VATFLNDAVQFRGTPVGFRLFPIVLLVLFGLVLLIGSINVAASASGAGSLASARGDNQIGAWRQPLPRHPDAASERFLLSLLGAAAGPCSHLAQTDWPQKNVSRHAEFVRPIATGITAW
jgi:hypothetical protein